MASISSPAFTTLRSSLVRVAKVFSPNNVCPKLFFTAKPRIGWLKALWARARIVIITSSPPLKTWVLSSELTALMLASVSSAFPVFQPLHSPSRSLYAPMVP